MRKLFISALLIFTICAFLYPTIGSTHDSIKPIEEAVLQEGADFDSAELSGFSLINRNFMKYSEMEKIINGLAGNIGSNKGQYNKVSGDDSEYHQVVYQDKNAAVPFVISLQSYKLPSGNESYLIVNYYIKDKNADIDDIYEKVGKCFAGLKVRNPQISVIVTGHYKGQLAEKDMDKKMNSIMSYLDASYHKNKMYDNLFTATGYSDKIREYIKLGSEKINVDLAMRYSSNEDKTYIWLGSPVITTDY